MLPDSEQGTKDESTTTGRSKTSQVYKFIDTFNTLAIDVDEKNAITHQTEHFGFVGVYHQPHFAHLFFQIENHLERTMTQ